MPAGNMHSLTTVSKAQLSSVCACVRACMHARDQDGACSLASQCGGVVPRRSLSQVARVDGGDWSVGLRSWHQAAKQRADVLAQLARSREQGARRHAQAPAKTRRRTRSRRGSAHAGGRASERGGAGSRCGRTAGRRSAPAPPPGRRAL
jgi:hypothetical protein